ncbi:MAG: IS3 family transposase [Paracoccaceae bacterium]
MIEPANANLSISKQCKLLSISRSSFYYEPKGESEMNLDLMRVIDKQFLETPFYGVRQMTWHLRNDGHLVNEKRIRRLMRLMGLMPIHCPAGFCEANVERVSKAQYKQSREGAQDLPLPAARSACGSAQSGLVLGYHLPAHAARLLVPGRGHGLAHAQGAGVAYLKHAGSRVLRRCAERSHP